MPRKNKYYPDYIKMYPCLKERKDILQALRQSDRKMKYIEVDLKRERHVVDEETQVVAVLPSREDSYERLTDENQRDFASDSNLEELVCRKDEVRRLRLALLQLNMPDRILIDGLYFEGLSEREYAKKHHQHYMTVHSHKVRILAFLKKIMEK